VRYVNYVINDKGQYINKDTIHTINVVAYFDTTITPWKKISESILQYDDTLDNIYVGLEDVRLFSFNGNLLYNCNRCINSQQFMIESGAIQKNYTENSKLLKINQQKHIEKNWVLFKAEREKAEREKAEREKEEHGKIKLIYNWYPLTICDVRDNECIIDKTIETPNFFRYVRGSTNGIIIGDEIWFLCHLVSYEDRRYYYHLFVVLDNATFNVKKYTQFFTFQKLPVEYTLGFIYLEERKEFLIGYSILDRETKYVSLPKDSVDRLMV